MKAFYQVITQLSLYHTEGQINEASEKLDEFFEEK